MYPNDYDQWASIRDALAIQYPQPNAQPMPQMTPEVRSYGPMHQALSSAFSQYLGQMMQPGLLAPPSREAMGLLSPEITPAEAVSMPSRGSAALGPNQYYRLDAPFWQAMRNKSGGGLDIFRGQQSPQAVQQALADAGVTLPTNISGGVGGVGVGGAGGF